MKYQVFVCADPRFEADMGNLVKLAIMIQDDQVHAKLQLGGIFIDPYALLEHIIKEQCMYGIYILTTDVLNGERGIKLAQKIKTLDEQAKVILSTPDILQSYLVFENNVKVLDCIDLKKDRDIIQSRLNNVILQAVEQLELANRAKQTIFYYRRGTCLYTEKLDDIVCIKTTTYPHRLCLDTTEGSFEISGSLQKIAQAYPSLLRISRSCLVNENNIYLIDIGTHKVVFVNGKVEYYSRRASKVIKKLLQYRENNRG